jgi:hypothetical protein
MLARGRTALCIRVVCNALVATYGVAIGTATPAAVGATIGAAIATASCAGLAAPLFAQGNKSLFTASVPAPRVLDRFERLDGWGTFPAEGVSLELFASAGVTGHAMTMSFDFKGKAGYAIARKAFAIGTPTGNWSFSFKARGRMRPNTLEFKLLDRSGDNVWWYTIPEFQPTGEWQAVVIRQRQISFAWGPLGGGPPRDIANIEIVVTAGQGGHGTLTLDDLVLTPLPVDVAVDGVVSATAVGTLAESDARNAIDRDTMTVWRAAIPAVPNRVLPTPSLTLDLGGVRTYGGLVITWAHGQQSPRVTVDSSNDGVSWNVAGSLNGARGTRSYLPMRDGSSRYLRLRFATEAGQAHKNATVVGVRTVSVRPLAFAATPTKLLESIARDEPRGAFPRSLHDEQNYWAVIGVSGGSSEALLSEDGQLELAKRGPSLEPFLTIGHQLVSWADVTPAQSLLDSVRPIPTVTWRTATATLSVTAFAAGSIRNSSTYARYRVVNHASTRLTGTLWLALRPLQVNPPQQFLNTPGGAARVDSIDWNGAVLRVNATLRVEPLTLPVRVGASTLDAGEASEWIANNRMPPNTHIVDRRSLGSAVMAWALDVAAGDSTDVVVATVLDGSGDPDRVARGKPEAVSRASEARLADVARIWAAEQDVVSIHLPPTAPPIAAALKANLAWILINRDGPGIQPGSRSYERSWIRDGTLTSEALLRLGRANEAKAFAEWYARYQYTSGKVPCCVDARGADPVDEHDSHGEFIHLVYEVWRFTHDTSFAMRLLPHVERAEHFIDSLSRTERTAAYDGDSLRAFRGLLPASISHEGYSAKPMHSVWDDGFALLGLIDAHQLRAELQVSRPDTLRRDARAQFALDFKAAVLRAMQAQKISYVPGSIELGDFDATSTTTLITPGGLLTLFPQAAFDSTFARYYRNARGRTKPDSTWENYTPYEWRTVSAMLQLGMKHEALAMVDQFMRDRRPVEWQQWAEVVWRDKRAAKFIGDMPHTWVGSDFIRSALDLFAFEDVACGGPVAPESASEVLWDPDNSRHSCLVIGAGIPLAWTPSGDSVMVRGLRTPWGPLGYTMTVSGKTVTTRIDAGLRMPPNGILLRTPFETPIVAALIDGVHLTARELRARSSRDPASLSLSTPARVVVLTYE